MCNLYLILYGEEEMFLIHADDIDHAKEQFYSWSENNLGDITEVFICESVWHFEAEQD